jgi:hypothetical protein
VSEQLKRLIQLQDDIHGAYGVWGADDLAEACTAAAEVPGFGGNPAALHQIAANYDQVWRTAQQGYIVVHAMWQRGISRVWAGDTHVSANNSLRALTDDLSRGLESIRALTERLRAHATYLESSLQSDAAYASQLREVAAQAAKLTVLGFAPNPMTWDGDEMRAAHAAGRYAVDGRVDCHVGMRNAGEDFADFAHDLAARARAGRLSRSPLSALDELVIAEAGLDLGHEAVLTAAMNDRAAAALTAMNDADRRRMTGLLAGAASAEQRAYLLKTLAAGYSVTDVARLNAMIAAHGGEPAWLDEHLSPLAMDGGVGGANAFEGAAWAQGAHPTCVAASTVAARAEVDPVYALQLTSGGHPDDPASDNPQAFAQRLLDEQYRVYDGGRHWYENWGQDGMNRDQSTAVANEEIAPHTGVRYENVEMDDAEARRSAVHSIARAVDDGYPVPISTREAGEGHQMMAIGHVGDQIQIYNPWGYTYWVSEADFVAGHIDAVDPELPGTPYAMRLPAGVR